MRNRFTAIILICAIFITHVVSAATISEFVTPRGFVFYRDLTKGTTSPDVMFLQNILNMSTSTRVSTHDRGSNSKLTGYFGDKTHNALYRFQQVFKDDIDFEIKNSTTSTKGFILDSKIVDRFTREVLNKLIVIYNDDKDQFTNSTTTKSYSILDFKKDNSSLYKNLTTEFNFLKNGQLAKIIDGGNQTVFGYTPKASIVNNATTTKVKEDKDTSSVLGAIAAILALSSFGGNGGGGGTAATTPIQPFGGAVESMTVCTCSANTLLYIKDPRGPVLPLLYQPGATILYSNFRPTVGVNVLGQYISGGQCLIYVGTGCSSGGTPIGTMVQLGTSLGL